ncbi:unnamed protein product [Victoria cruziana]
MVDYDVPCAVAFYSISGVLNKVAAATYAVNITARKDMEGFFCKMDAAHLIENISFEIATHGFADENVIGEGGYDIVYRGVLRDNSGVAIKNLLNNRGQAEKEFKVEVEAIGRIRHKNLVDLDNGNLEQRFHGDVGSYSPLTWEIQMKYYTWNSRRVCGS